MRAIVRFSLNGDAGSRLGSQLKGILHNGGISYTISKTGTYEGHNLSTKSIQDILSKFWIAVDSHTGTAFLDHFWMYCDADSSRGQMPTVEQLATSSGLPPDEGLRPEELTTENDE